MKLENILTELRNGKTLIIANYLHAWKINQKTVEKFEKINRPVLKEKSDGLYMSSGRNYVCVNGCALRFI